MELINFISNLPRWQITIVLTIFLSFSILLFHKVQNYMRIRLRMVGLIDVPNLVRFAFLALKSEPIRDVVFVVATTVVQKREGQGPNVGTGIGQVRGVFAIVNRMSKAYGFLPPDAVYFSEQFKLAQHGDQNHVIVIGGPKNNVLMRECFEYCRYKIDFSKSEFGDLELGENEIIVHSKSAEVRAYRPITSEGAIVKVYGFIARFANPSSQTGKKLLLLGGTRTQGTYAACQFAVERFPVFKSMLNPNFFAIIEAEVVGGSISQSIKILHFWEIGK